MNQVILAPSLLAGNHANLADSAKLIGSSGCEWIHLDIMDGHFVPNLTFGPQMLKDLRKTSKLFFDTHLMLSNPHEFIHEFAEAGANLITVHVEPNYDIHDTLSKIRSLNCQTGLAINPDTSEDEVLPFIEEVDLILVMMVQPGFGGQAFRGELLPKISRIKQWRAERELNFRIEVDGGINERTSKECIDAGADTIVTGTSFFKDPTPSNFLPTHQVVDAY